MSSMVDEESQEDLWGVPPQSISWDVQPPHNVTGVVLSQQKMQTTDFDTKQPEYWDDAKTRPKMKIVVELQTELQEDDNDDGKRQLHVKVPSALFASIREAITTVPGKRLLDGDTLSVTYTHDGEQSAEDRKKKRNPPKQFTSAITR